LREDRKAPGTLFLVGTPIGNMGDLSPRARETLESVSRIAAEDTRRTGLLLSRIGVRTPMASFHAHNEAKRIPEILARLARGESVAVVSDAGNPGISDPAERLVRAAVESGFAIVPIPGPSAFVAALVASGLPSGSFVFEGYLPSRASARREALRALRSERRTILLHESPKRVAALLDDVRDVLGDRRVVLAREITKKFEEFARGTAGELLARLRERAPKGEFVVVVEGAPPGEPLEASRVLGIVREEIAAGRTLRDAVRAAARIARWKEQEVYRLASEGSPFDAPSHEAEQESGSGPKKSPVSEADRFVRYVILLTIVRPELLCEDLVRAHVAHLKRIEERGHLELCGPFADKRGGIVILRGVTEEDARTLAEADPFVSSGADRYELRRLDLSSRDNDHMGMG